MTHIELLDRMKPFLTLPASLGSAGNEDANKALVARMFLEIVNLKAYEVADEIFAEDFHWPQFDLHGPEGAKAWARSFHAGWPDVQDRIELQIAQGDWVVSLVSVYGTQVNPWAGLAASGRTHAFQAIGFDRIRDGRIVERFALFDLAGVAQALGHDLVAQPEKT